MKSEDGPKMRGPNYDWKHEAEHYREECDKLRALLYKMECSSDRAINSAVLEEREACAKLVDSFEERRWRTLGQGGDLTGYLLPNISKAIRSRGEK